MFNVNYGGNMIETDACHYPLIIHWWGIAL